MTAAVIAGVAVALAAVAVSARSIYWTRRLHRARLEAGRLTPLRARQLDDVIAHDTIDPRRRR